MLDKILDFALVVASFILCFMFFWHVQTARNFEIVGGEWILLFIPVAIGVLIFKKKKG